MQCIFLDHAMTICDVYKRLMFSFPSEIKMAEKQEYFGGSIYPYDPTSEFQEVDIASD